VSDKGVLRDLSIRWCPIILTKQLAPLSKGVVGGGTVHKKSMYTMYMVVSIVPKHT